MRLAGVTTKKPLLRLHEPHRSIRLSNGLRCAGTRFGNIDSTSLSPFQIQSVTLPRGVWEQASARHAQCMVPDHSMDPIVQGIVTNSVSSFAIGIRNVLNHLYQSRHVRNCNGLNLLHIDQLHLVLRPNGFLRSTRFLKAVNNQIRGNSIFCCSSPQPMATLQDS